MKVETTITIEADLLEQVKNAAKNFRSASEIYERALREYLPKLKEKPAKRKLTREQEIEALNRIGTEQREEILESLSYQTDLRGKDESSSEPNRAMLEALRKVSERSVKMPVSSDGDTLKLIREARSGGMFGDASDQ